jgi:hypothetical protein
MYEYPHVIKSGKCFTSNWTINSHLQVNISNFYTECTHLTGSLIVMSLTLPVVLVTSATERTARKIFCNMLWIYCQHVLSLRAVWDLLPFDLFRKIVLVFASERKFGLFMSVLFHSAPCSMRWSLWALSRHQTAVSTWYSMHINWKFTELMTTTSF